MVGIFGVRTKLHGNGILTLAIVSCAIIATVTLVLMKVSTYDELLLKLHLAAHEPYSPPSNLYLWWGPETNHRFVGSGERIRQLLHLGIIEGGEWRDPMFLGNNGVETFASSRFRRIGEQCCSTILFPPMEWNFPVFNTHKIVGQRIRNFVANGNIFVLTGGIPAIEFINYYFFYTLELADGNYSPGPFRRLDKVPPQFLDAPTILPQKGISVTAVKKESLPSGATVLWGTPRTSPVFMIKFCEAQSPDEGMPPVKVLPRDCSISASKGRPCSCGHIIYIGYAFHDPYPSRWDKVLLASVEILNPTWDCDHPSVPAAAQACTASKAATGQVAPALAATPQVAAVSSAPVAAAPAAVASPSTVKSALAPAPVTKMAPTAALVNEDRLASALVSALTTLEHQSKVAAQPVMQPGTVDQDNLAQQPLSVLEKRAESLMQKIHSVEDLGGRDDEHDENGRHPSAAGNRMEAVLEKSMLSLAKDVKEINGKVNKLANVVARARHAGARRIEHNHNAAPAAASPAGESAAAVAAAAAATASLQHQLNAAKRRAAAAAQKAAAYRQELEYEQAIPGAPVYSHPEEPDHTTPLFADGVHHFRRGARGGKVACGKLCQLRSLVEKTRGRIDAELRAAMHASA